MRPYYQDNYSTLYLGDCRQILPDLELSNVAIISDPPYGMNFNYERKRTSKSTKIQVIRPERKNVVGDDEPFNPHHLLNYPIIALFGANHYSEHLPSSSKWLIWDKRCGSGQDNFSDCEMVWTNQDGACRIHYQKWRGVVREGEENLSRAYKFHSAQKPVSLMRWVIGQLKVPSNYIICDPYCGSGSTLVAAQQLGYRTIGLDLVEECLADAKQRLQQKGLCFEQTA